jgi:hypothetical protein
MAAMMDTADRFGNRFMTGEVDRRRGFVRVTRTREPYPTLAEIPSSAAELLAHVPGDAPRKLLIDFRDGPTARNDPEFEAASFKARSLILGYFPIHAILVRSAVGMLQVNRLAKERGATTNVFLEEAAAIAFLQGAH